ncbi:MAG: NERD domain-containing protein, partial [Verrucomicrobiaceae bacterium]
MSFAAYLPSGFQHRHENELFDAVVRTLHARFDGVPGAHVLIGNVMFEGHEMDGVLLKPNGICIIEMKNHGGQVHFSENTQWYAGSHEVRGGNQPNPFQQVRTYRFALRNYLRAREEQILQKGREAEWSHISGVVLFGREIQFDDRVLGALRSWFHVTDVPRLADRLASISSNRLSLSSEDFDALLRLLGLDERHLYTTTAEAVGQPLQASLRPSLGPMHLTYLKEFPFRDYELRLRNLGGARSQAAQMVRTLFE